MPRFPFNDGTPTNPYPGLRDDGNPYGDGTGRQSPPEGEQLGNVPDPEEREAPDADD